MFVPADFHPALIPQALPDDEVHIWFCEWPIDTPARQRRRAQQFLLNLLSAYVGQPLTDADLSRGEHGKPALSAVPELGFSLSHCHDMAVLALGRDIDLGIDLEQPGRPRRYEVLAQRFFCPAEAQALAALNVDQREAAFLSLWTAKEAVLKATGRGLAFGLDRLEFALDQQAAPQRLQTIAAPAGPATAWQLQRLQPRMGAFGCVAWRGAARRLRFFRIGASLTESCG